MKAWILAMAGSVALLSGCAAPKKPQPVAPTAQLVTAEKAYVDASVAKLKNSLKDPGSAKLYGIYAIQKPGQPHPSICGFVNAKNSYGGYTGKTMFLATPDVAVVAGGLMIREQSLGSEVIASNCALAAGQPAPPSQDIEYR
ncbi:hypothetical protein [Achromobacter marplatensis]|uniref:Lipoprotein n=1 Tax=Achromobacter marplatensis TaxID=470868 RepID=A0AA42WC31_9BURK|nr:hypothetical protein [Achromobacter marplatensis]MDH2051187.1 hypothetical protein [Achromobacter marplatensis]